MNGKKYVTYKCNKCLRTKDIEIDNSTYYQSLQGNTSTSTRQRITFFNPFIDKCNITQNCDGKLIPLSSKSVRSVLPSLPQEGLIDWSPRNKLNLPTSSKTVDSTYIDISTASSFKLALAIKSTFISPPEEIKLNFSAQAANANEYVEYNYYMTSSFTSIVGADSSANAKVLRFSPADTIKVYANGVELEENTNYTLVYNGDIGYQINFATSYLSSTLIKVVVYQTSLLVHTQDLTFKRNDLLVITTSNQTAWSNVLHFNFGKEATNNELHLADATSISYVQTFQFDIYQSAMPCFVYLNNVKLNSSEYVIDELHNSITFNNALHLNDKIKVIQNGQNILVTTVTLTSQINFSNCFYDPEKVKIFINDVNINDLVDPQNGPIYSYVASTGNSLVINGSLLSTDVIKLSSENIYTVYTCEDTSSLPVNTLLNIYSHSQIQGLDEVALNDIHLLLADMPYTAIDRIYSVTIPLSNIFASDQHVKFFTARDEKQLQASSPCLMFHTSPIILNEVTDINLEFVSDLTGSDLTEKIINPNIIGPI